MLPKKAKDFAKQTAEQLGHDESLVLDVMGFYWKKLRHEVIYGVEPIIDIYGFGQMYVKSWEIDKVIARKEELLKIMDPLAFRNFARVKSLEESVSRLDLIREKLKELDNQKKRYKIIRKQYEKDNPTVEEPKADLGGIPEQPVQAL